MSRTVKEAYEIEQLIQRQLHKKWSVTVVPAIRIEPAWPRDSDSGANWHAHPITGEAELLLDFDEAVKAAQQQYDLKTPPLGGSTTTQFV
ncbi:hypothetical protein [Comamonas terrigena]|uniref:hypothetical protein n=1 Tax=Comamonas terrigena TaxID=32013 RepID=UPI00289F3143|nr:hypothetical protein [Comamonas terrigena]